MPIGGSWDCYTPGFDVGSGPDITVINLFRAPNFLGSMRIVSDHNALAETTERLFPASRHRSARIRKKLIQRHGSEFRKVPTAYELANGTLVCHPEISRHIDEALKRTVRDWSERLYTTGLTPEANGLGRAFASNATSSIPEPALTAKSLLETLVKLERQFDWPKRRAAAWAEFDYLRSDQV